MRRDDSSGGARSGLIYDCDIFVLMSYESVLLRQKASEKQNEKLKINEVLKKIVCGINKILYSKSSQGFTAAT